MFPCGPRRHVTLFNNKTLLLALQTDTPSGSAQRLVFFYQQRRHRLVAARHVNRNHTKKHRMTTKASIKAHLNNLLAHLVLGEQAEMDSVLQPVHCSLMRCLWCVSRLPNRPYRPIKKITLLNRKLRLGIYQSDCNCLSTQDLQCVDHWFNYVLLNCQGVTAHLVVAETSCRGRQNRHINRNHTQET